MVTGHGAFPPTLLTAFVLLPGLAAPGSAQEPPERWTLEEELRIGAYDDGEYGLTRTRAMAVAEDGTMYLAQPQENRIRVFDRHGRFVRFVGRSGGGPGQFRSVGGIGLRGDTLWVTDSVQGRVTLFDHDGDMVESFSLAMAPPGMRPSGYPAGVWADGSVVVFPREGRGDAEGLPIVRADRAGAIVDTLALWSAHGGGGRIQTGQRVMLFRQPVPDQTLRRLAPNGRALVLVDRPAPEDPERGTFTVHWISDEWSRRRTFTFHPLPLSADGLEGTRRNLMEAVRTRMGLSRREAEAQVNDALSVPRFAPGVTDLAVGPDGTVWLRREESDQQTVPWAVIHPGRGWIANATVPANVTIIAVDGSRAWGIETDEMEVPFLVRYRVESTAR